jgi:hypothetical protein
MDDRLQVGTKSGEDLFGLFFDFAKLYTYADCQERVVIAFGVILISGINYFCP